MATEHLSVTLATDSDVLTRKWWLFSPRVDIGAFLGSAIGSLALLWVGAQLGLLEGDSPDWAWVPAVLLVDVAHVYATGFRVYFDTSELKRRAWLYVLAPLLAFGIGVALYSEGDMLFWRALAYLAVFHFVRQQYGWVALYRARLNENNSLGWWIDTVAIYMATIYPLIYWHSHLPRRFWWFLANDFAQLPLLIERLAWPVYCLALTAYAVRSGYAWLVSSNGNPGKDVVVITTAICWYAGIVAFNSDYAFTVTNVIIHGIPYMALVWWYAKSRQTEVGKPYKALTRWPLVFVMTLWAFAYAEELLWDRSLWHERAWLFGQEWDVSSFKVVLIPLLALPQITHYILDGFIWRRKSNPSMSQI